MLKTAARRSGVYMVKTPGLLFVLIALMLISSHTFSHHSFAVHFVPDEIVTVSGVVTKFSFSNPHGLVFFTVINADGEEEAWRAETNSPSLLRRRGWSKDSIKPGDEVSIRGYPTRDGSPYLRINLLTFTDGSELIGQGRILENPAELD